MRNKRRKIEPAKIVNYDQNYCNICKRKFKSKLSLRMHLVAAKVHRKGTPYYHDRRFCPPFPKNAKELVRKKNTNSLDKYIKEIKTKDVKINDTQKPECT